MPQEWWRGEDATLILPHHLTPSFPIHQIRDDPGRRRGPGDSLDALLIQFGECPLDSYMPTAIVWTRVRVADLPLHMICADLLGRCSHDIVVWAVCRPTSRRVAEACDDVRHLAASDSGGVWGNGPVGGLVGGRLGGPDGWGGGLVGGGGEGFVCGREGRREMDGRRRWFGVLIRQGASPE